MSPQIKIHLPIDLSEDQGRELHQNCTLPSLSDIRFRVVACFVNLTQRSFSGPQMLLTANDTYGTAGLWSTTQSQRTSKIARLILRGHNFLKKYF